MRQKVQIKLIFQIQVDILKSLFLFHPKICRVPAAISSPAQNIELNFAAKLACRLVWIAVQVVIPVPQLYLLYSKANYQKIDKVGYDFKRLCYLINWKFEFLLSYHKFIKIFVKITESKNIQKYLESFKVESFINMKIWRVCL